MRIARAGQCPIRGRSGADFPGRPAPGTLPCMIITIDGPAGSGKSTAARGLAAAMGMTYLDTGATYRAVTLKALGSGADMTDAAALARIAREADIELHPLPHGLKVILDGADVTDAVRAPKVTNSVHYLAGPPQVRAVLIELQRRIGKALGEFVTEGRDQGSVVFPEADLKFYLDATPQTRAQRRCEELRAAGLDANLDEVLQDMLQRDWRDRGRSAGPLVKPDGAVVVDTSGNTVTQTLNALVAHVETRR